jgi:hypothetical protein
MLCLRINPYSASMLIWSLYPKWLLPFFFVHRASVSFCDCLWGLVSQSGGISPYLICLFSSRLLCCIGTDTRVASMIWPPLASYPLASRNPLNASNSSSINPASVNRWRNSHTVVASGTSAVGLSSKNRRNEPLSWVWYSSSSSPRLYSC